MKKAVRGKGGRESRKAEGRAQKLAAKRETEGILAEGGGGVAHFVDNILKHLGQENII